MKRLVASLILALASPLVAPSANAEVNVVVTIKPVHALVAGVMQGVATPRLLVGGASSPHSYAMRPSDAVALGKADVFFRISEDLEPFTRKLVRSMPKTVQVVTLADAPKLVGHDVREGGDFESHDHDHGHSHGHAHKSDKAELDPHIWLDPSNAKIIVATVADVLAQKLPAKADVFRANARALSERLDVLDREMVDALAPAKGKPYVVFHDAYQYLEARYGLTPVGSITVNPEVQPSGRRLSALRTKIEKLSAVCILSEPQFEPKIVTAIARGTNARTGQLDPLGAAVEPGPDLYFTMMRNLAKSLTACLVPAA